MAYYAGNYCSSYSVYELDYWARALSDAEALTASQSAQTRTALASSINFCAFVGTSITWGAAGYSYAYMFFDNSQYYGANYGVPSSNLYALNAEAPTIDALLTINAGLVAHNKNILCVECGTNDIGVLNNRGSISAFLSAYQSYLSARKAAGWKVVAQTVLPRTEAGTYASDRATVNTAIRSWIGAYVDVVADWASDPTMGPDGAATNTTYYYDGVHPTTAGYTLLTPYTQTAINSF